MDSRHETLDQEVLNRFIKHINHYISTNVDEVLIKTWLATDILRMSEYIYKYAQMNVPLTELLAKNNFLSLDMVLLPQIDDATLCQAERKSSDFSQMLNSIQAIVAKRNNVDMGRHDFYTGIEKILTDYHF